MDSINIRSMKHDTSRLIERVEMGESVEIRRRNQPVAVIQPVLTPGSTKRPDFKARLADIYGDALLEQTGTEVVSSERGDR